MQVPSALTNKKSKTAISVIRSMNNIQTLIQKRKNQRSMVVYNLAHGKFQNSLIYARQLVYTSQKIWRQFDDSFKQDFQQSFYYRTSKNKQFTQYLLDNMFICKINSKSKKFEQIQEIIQRLQLPDIQYSRNRLPAKNQQEILQYNQLRQIEYRICGCLLTLIQISKEDKKPDSTIKVFRIYQDFVKAHYSQFQLATAYFKFGNYYSQIKQYEKAIEKYEECTQIRKKNSLNQGYVDVLLNCAICFKKIGKYTDALKRIQESIEIYSDLNKSQGSDNIIDDLYLFLYKLKLQSGKFAEAYQNILTAYAIRSKKEPSDPKRVQIQINLLFFYKTLQRIQNQALTQSVFNIKDRKQIQKKRKQAKTILSQLTQTILNRQQFIKYDDFSSRMVHLVLTISQPFFDKLNSQQVIELQNFLNKLGSYSFRKGLTQLFKTTFFENQNTRDLLIQANPHINFFGKNHN